MQTIICFNTDNDSASASASYALMVSLNDIYVGLTCIENSTFNFTYFISIKNKTKNSTSNRREIVCSCANLLFQCS